MVMPKVPAEFCIDTITYKEFIKDGWEGAEYADPIVINHCRVDRGAEYSQSSNGKQLLFNALIFLYVGITDPIPKVKAESIILIDEIDHKVTKVIPIYEAYENTLYSYEIEVI